MDLIMIGTILAAASLPFLWSQYNNDLNVNSLEDLEEVNHRENAKTP